MSIPARGAVVAVAAGLIGLAGCGSVLASSPGAAKSSTPATSTPSASAMAPSKTAAPSPTPWVCPRPGSYLTVIRVGEHSGYDRVVFMVVQAWARGRWGGTLVVRQVDAGTFKVTEPGGLVDTVTGTRPVTVPGPWVITMVTTGSV